MRKINYPTKAKKRNVVDPDVQLRKCLGPNCGEAFLSEWAGNRICPSCKRTLSLIDSSEEQVVEL